MTRYAKRTDANHAEKEMDEIWKDIAGSPGYMVSNLGRVKSLDRTILCRNGSKQRRPGRVMKLNELPLGYLDVELGKNRHFLVHRLVALAFCEGYFDGAQVNHKDGNRQNNVPGNLEWCTSSENHRHAIRILGRKANRNSGAASGKSKRVRCIDCETGAIIHEFNGAREAARALSIDYQRITCSARGEIRKPTKTRWEYVA
jgi:hypothetical protein